MKSYIVFILCGLLVCTSAKPTLDVIEDIIHDIHDAVHDPYQNSNYRTPHVQNGPYVQGGYYPPTYTQGYGYNQKLYPQPGGQYPVHPQGEYYTPSGTGGGYGHNSVYNNQGYYQGPPYPRNNNGYNNYNNNGYSNPSQHGYRNHGY